MSKLTEKILAAKAEGRTALIPFLPGGYPDRERFWKEITGLDDAGADVIEIGMPFSDPVADGPVVEHASLKALADGVNLTWILAELKQRRQNISAAIVLMGYYNPVYQHGLERFAREAAEAGVDGVIIADMSFEEDAELRAALTGHGVDLVPLVGLNTSPERMKVYAERGGGFAYFVSVLGTTGDRDSLPAEVRRGLEQAKSIFDLPIALGFGLKDPKQLEELDGLVDAAVFGSALIRHLDAGGTGSGFLSAWK